MNLQVFFVTVTILVYSQFLLPQEITIKTLQNYSGNRETTLPVISDGGYLTIEFDIESQFVPDLNIVFRFCDRNWIPYDNIFLSNTGQEVAYNIEVNSLPVVYEEADYHFKGSFPNSYDAVSFPFSGKWIFHITDSNDTTVIYATGRFIVVHREIELESSLKHERLEDETFFPAELAKVFNITTDFILPDELHPSFVTHLEIIENQKIHYPVIVDRYFNTNRRNYYWDGNRRFTFTARDIRPGNEYRTTDLRDIKTASGEEVRAQFDGIEYARFYQNPPRDLNGGFIISRKEIFPMYLDVLFEFKPHEENFGSIFLTGAFNDWQVLPEYEMDFIDGVYTKIIKLKRGAYDYQYVSADFINNRIENEDWFVHEGNNHRTTNVYHLLLYYNDPDYGGYDRIIGYDIVLNK